MARDGLEISDDEMGDYHEGWLINIPKSVKVRTISPKRCPTVSNCVRDGSEVSEMARDEREARDDEMGDEECLTPVSTIPKSVKVRTISPRRSRGDWAQARGWKCGGRGRGQHTRGGRAG